MPNGLAFGHEPIEFLVNCVVPAAAWLVVAATIAAHPADAKTFAMADGRAVVLPDRASVVGEPALSPDGRHVAYIRAAGPKPDDQDDRQPTEIVVAELPDGSPEVVVHPSSSYWDLRSAVSVTYATDGQHIYVEAACPCSSDSIHEIAVITGSHHRIAWGIEMAVLRGGPWRGDLLMGVHTCYRSHPGCDYPVHVVTPAGKSVFVVPGTSGADRPARLQSWLAKRGWRAW